MFWGMVMYDNGNGFKIKEIKLETRIKLSHNIYIKETRQNRDSHIFAGRWIFCFWLASFKINSTI